jgi:hypothetical protein
MISSAGVVPKRSSVVNYVVGTAAGSAVALRVFAGKRLLRGIPGSRLAAVLGTAASGLKLAHTCVLVARKELPPGRILLPTIFFVELLRISLGQTSRAAMIATVFAFEVLVVAYAVVLIRRLGAAAQGTEMEVHYQRVFRLFLPDGIALLLAHELLTLSAGLRWAARGFRTNPVPGFSYTQQSTLRMLPVLLPLITLGDEIVFGVLLRHQAAWIRVGIVALDLWAILWLFGFYATLQARPHLIEKDRVLFRVGAVHYCEFDPALVISATPFSEYLTRQQRKNFGCLTVSGTPTVKVQLREPVVVHRLGRADLVFDTLLVAADDPSGLCRNLMQKRDGASLKTYC